MQLYGLSGIQQARIIWWLGGLAPLATNVVTPIVTRARFDHTNLSAQDKWHNVQQENIRQGISAGLHIVTYFGFGWLFKKGLGQLLKHKQPLQALDNPLNNPLVAAIGSSIGNFIGYAFIRPLISSELILHWLYPNKPATLLFAAATFPEKLPESPVTAQGHFEQFLQGILKKRQERTQPFC